jgi:hypothetical protein
VRERKVPDVRIAVLRQGIELKAPCQPKFLLQSYLTQKDTLELVLIPPFYFTVLLYQKLEMVKIKIAAGRAPLSARAGGRAGGRARARKHTQTQFP